MEKKGIELNGATLKEIRSIYFEEIARRWKAGDLSLTLEPRREFLKIYVREIDTDALIDTMTACCRGNEVSIVSAMLWKVQCPELFGTADRLAEAYYAAVEDECRRRVNENE